MLLSDVAAAGVCTEDVPGNVVTTLLPAVNDAPLVFLFGVVPLVFPFGVLPPGVFSGLFPPPGFDGFKLSEEGSPFSTTICVAEDA